MLNNFDLQLLIPITLVTVSVVLLVYFAWKTLITASLFQKGLSLYQNKDYIGAEATFTQVISLNSTNDTVHLLLGDTFLQQGKMNEAIAEFQEVIARAPRKIDAYLRLSNALMQAGRLEEAIATLEQARDLYKAQRQVEQSEKIQQLLQEIRQKLNDV